GIRALDEPRRREPGNPRLRPLLLGLRLRRAEARARTGDYRRAAAEAEELSRDPTLPGPPLYELGSLLAPRAAASARHPPRPRPASSGAPARAGGPPPPRPPPPPAAPPGRACSPPPPTSPTWTPPATWPACAAATTTAPSAPRWGRRRRLTGTGRGGSSRGPP